MGGDPRYTHDPIEPERSPGLLALLTVLCVVAFCVVIATARRSESSNPILAPAGVSANTPACDAYLRGAIYLVTDGADASDCSIGGGNHAVLCVCDKEWSAVPAGRGTTMLERTP